MKAKQLFLLVLVTFGTSFQLLAQNTLLFKISHPKQIHESYVLGTMHMICEEEFAIPQKVSNALSHTKQLYLEMNAEDPSEQAELAKIMAQAKPISSVLEKEQIKKLDSILQPILGFPVATLDQYGLMMLYNYAIMSSMPCQKFKSYETELLALAKNDKKEVKTFETAVQQMTVLNQTYSDQELYNLLLDIHSYKADFNQATKHYLKEELEACVNLIASDRYMSKKAIEIMVTNRNKNWVEQLQQILPKEATFIAVGAAHLTGKKGVLHLLKKKGYKITPVL